MIGLIARFLSGGVVKALARAYEQRSNAKTEQERIAAEVHIAQLEANQRNRELGGRVTAIVQALWAAPFVVYNAKLIIWDKVLGLGATDPLSAPLYDTQVAIVSFYFGGAAAIGVVRAIRS